MGYVKTDAQRRADAIKHMKRQAAEDADALKEPVKTWPATMPAYAGTSLCCDPRFRKN